MAKTGNFRAAALNEACCPSCGAVTNPRWGKCLACKAMLSVVAEPKQPDTPVETIVPTPLGTIAKSKLPPENLNRQDWIDFYQERAAILEHDGGVSRAAAERLAHEAVVAGLANAMSTDRPQDHCSACGSPLAPTAGLPLADKAVVCDSACHDAHRQKQRDRAEWQLAEWDIATNPTRQKI